jgi:hypothetical protein
MLAKVEDIWNERHHAGACELSRTVIRHVVSLEQDLA